MTVTTQVAADQLKSIIDRIERLTEEKKGIMDDIKDIYLEAKGNGYDTKILKAIIKLRTKSSSEIQEEETLLEIYRRALGMLPSDDSDNQ